MENKASHFQNTLGQLDSLINQLEINLGRVHKPSPFQHSNNQNQQPSNQKSPKKQQNQQPQAQKSPQKNQNQQPKQEVKPQAAAQSKPVQEPKKAENNQKEQKQEKGPLPTVDDFSKIDIRVGRIIECWKHPESEKLYCEKIDIGSEVRLIASGIQQYQPIENMSGLVLVVQNLKARKLAGFESQGMLLCASNEDHTQVEILRPPNGSVVGERVFLEGLENKFPQQLQEALNPKKKILEVCLPETKTDNDYFATFIGKKWMTKAGYIKAEKLNSSNIS